MIARRSNKLSREELQAQASRSSTNAVLTSDSTSALADPAASPSDIKKIEVGKDRSLSDQWTNGFVAESADKSFRVHLGGRMEFDNSWFSQDDNILVGPSADNEMRDGTLMRRARFRGTGDYGSSSTLPVK